METRRARATRAQRHSAATLAALAAVGLALARIAEAATPDPTPAALAPASPPAALAPASPEEIVVEIVVNAEPRGQFFVFASNGSFLVRAADLEKLHLGRLGGHGVELGGEKLVALDSIPGLAVAFDERKLELRLQADPKLLPVTSVELGAGRNERTIFPTNASAFLNYELSYAGGDSVDTRAIGLSTELGARAGDFLFLDDSTYLDTGSARRYVRLATSLIHDDRTRLTRAILGDFAAGSSALLSVANLGGVSYSRLYTMDPYFVRYPQQAITGFLSTPSEVDVYVDGQRVRTLRLPAGGFDLRDVTQSTGLRNVQLVVRDAYGHEQRIDAPYYSTDAPLKAGLQEFSYNLGALRQMYGIESDRYGPLAFSAFHRFGVTDFLTLGFAGEARSGVYNAGPTATIVLGTAGVVGMAAAASGSDTGSGGAATASYAYSGRHVSAGLALRAQSRDYTRLVPGEADPDERSFVATLGYTDPVVGGISTGYSRSRSRVGLERRSASVTFARPLFRSRASFSFTVVRNWGVEHDTNLFAGLVYDFGADYALSARHDRVEGTAVDALEFRKSQPIGEGLGYTLAAQRVAASDGTSTVLQPSVQYNGRWGIVRAAATQQSDAAGSHASYALSNSGGFAWAAGAFSMGRPVDDAFGVVKVDDIAGVQVSVNGQKIGKTDASGRLLVPTLASFTDNQIAIDPADVPLEYSFPESVKVVSPPYRGGSLVEFHARRLHAIGGTLKIRLHGVAVPAEFFQGTIEIGGHAVAFPLGRGGEFYVEDIGPGTYAARIEGGAEACAFELVVPKSDDPITDLGEIVCGRDVLGLRLSRSLRER